MPLAEAGNGTNSPLLDDAKCGERIMMALAQPLKSSRISAAATLECNRKEKSREHSSRSQKRARKKIPFRKHNEPPHAKPRFPVTVTRKVQYLTDRIVSQRDSY
jgi:hypothetical protein